MPIEPNSDVPMSPSAPDGLTTGGPSARTLPLVHAAHRLGHGGVGGPRSYGLSVVLPNPLIEA